MRSYAMCHIPDTSISYAESPGSLHSGWSPGETHFAAGITEFEKEREKQKEFR